MSSKYSNGISKASAVKTSRLEIPVIGSQDLTEIINNRPNFWEETPCIRLSFNALYYYFIIPQNIIPN